MLYGTLALHSADLILFIGQQTVRHQSKRQCYHVFNKKSHPKAFLSQLKEAGKPLTLGGDERAESPGHSSKYGSLQCD